MAGRVDVIVVGAGSAGAVVAARLSERAGRSVLLLEAGPDHRSADTPEALAGASFLEAIAEPGRVWDRLDAVRTGGQLPRQYARGRGVGGSSAVNAMVALPGEPDDFDEWERRYGAVGWSWRDVAPWFDRIAIRTTVPGDAELGSVGGALLAADPAAERAHLTRTATGRRVSVNDAYLEPARATPGLTVRGDATVDCVLFDGRRACGVRLADGAHLDARAVVVCAGAIHSPVVLLRSGVDRPGVGQGLQDHPSFPITLRLRDGFVAAPHSLVVSTLLRATHERRHDLQVLPLNDADPAVPGLGVLLGALMRVESRGSVALSSLDPTAPPNIDFVMLSDERDHAGMRGAVDLVERVAHHRAVGRIGEVLAYDSSDAGIRAALGDYVHATSTCRMGPTDDDAAVVDERCRVHGYESLWVCDASVMPRVPRANTHWPTVMIAERVAAWIDAELTSR